MALAGAWEVRPEVSATVGYDSNRGLSSENPVETGVGGIAGGLSLARSAERYKVQGIARIEYLAYTADQLRNRDNQLFSLKGYYLWDRAAVRPRFYWKRDSLLRSIALVTDPGDPSIDPTDSVDDALLRRDIRRNRLRIELPLEYKLTERALLGAEYAFRTTLYEDVPVGTSLFDFREHRVGATYQYGLTPRNTLGVRVQTTYYDSDRGRNATNYELLGEYRYKLSETSVLRITAGGRHTEAKIEGVDRSDTGFVAEIGIRQRLDRIRYAFQYEHRLYPSGTATLVETDQVLGKVFYPLTERWGIGARFRWFDTNRLDSKPSRANRQYLDLRPTLSYQWTPELAMDFFYRYRWQDRKDLDATADSHAVFVSIRWSKLDIWDGL